VALGFTGLAMMGLEFALVARFRAVAAPFGQDALLQFHREIGYVGLVFILTHFAISAHWADVTPAKAADPVGVDLGVPAERVHTERFEWPERGTRLRHVLMTRLVWLIAVLVVVACLVFAASQS